jgi:CDP-glycerol glycerophosphotransferase
MFYLDVYTGYESYNSQVKIIWVVNGLKQKEWFFKAGCKVILTYLFLFIGKLPTRKKTIVFESFLGRQYSDNPKAIYLYMKENYPDYQLYWSMDRRRNHSLGPLGSCILQRFSWKWMVTFFRAEYWIINSRLPLWIPKPKGTTYVQTWHGTPLKRLATDMDEVHMPGTNTKRYKQRFIKESKRWDYLLSPNAYSTAIFRRAFHFRGTVVEAGYPRNDILIHSNRPEIIHQLKQTVHLPLDKKVILYAPTWRDHKFSRIGKYKFDLKFELDKMWEQLNEDYIIVLRLHYLIAEKIDISGYANFIYDFSDYEEISTLYLMADVLITDYSSAFFDFANVRRPMLFYVDDLAEYLDKRGLYFDFNKNVPGPVVRTTEELIWELKKIEANHFQVDQTFEAFYQRFCYLEDGQASERVVKTIFNK